jgi:hypothetical protein
MNQKALKGENASQWIFPSRAHLLIFLTLNPQLPKYPFALINKRGRTLVRPPKLCHE